MFRLAVLLVCALGLSGADCPARDLAGESTPGKSVCLPACPAPAPTHPPTGRSLMVLVPPRRGQYRKWLRRSLWSGRGVTA